MTAQLKSWAQALGGEVSGRGVNCPGPGHGASDRSLSVTPCATAPDGFLVHTFSTRDDSLACRDHVRRKLGLPEFKPQNQGCPAPGTPSSNVELPNGTRNLALDLWRAARDPRETLVEQYLRSRALELPSVAANETIRFHPRCQFGSDRFPAMVCLVRNIVTNEPQGVHRTALALDGTSIKRNGKTFRMSLGPTSGGAIKLDPDEDVTQGLCIGEGVETCLAGRQIGYRPVWAVGLAGITKFPVLPGIDGLTIFGERDEKEQNEKAIQKCAGRWLEAGIETLTVWPLAGNDLNDEVKAAL